MSPGLLAEQGLETERCIERDVQWMLIKLDRIRRKFVVRNVSLVSIESPKMLLVSVCLWLDFPSGKSVGNESDRFRQRES